MANKFATKHRSNHDIFIPYNSGSPQADESLEKSKRVINDVS
jgi:hypothetical protein